MIDVCVCVLVYIYYESAHNCTVIGSEDCLG